MAIHFMDDGFVQTHVSKTGKEESDSDSSDSDSDSD